MFVKFYISKKITKNYAQSKTPTKIVAKAFAATNSAY
jgi:hypothetical protein